MQRAVAIVISALLLGPTLAVMPSSAVADSGAAGTVDVRTVPATAGVRLRVGETVVTTGSRGTAQLHVTKLNGIARRVSIEASQLNPTTRVSLTRVSPAPHTMAHVSRLAVGLAVTSRVHLTVVSDAAKVSAGDVRALRLHSVTGKGLTAAPGTDVDLLARRAVLRHGTLTSQKVSWSVDRVTTSSDTAVTTAGPRFDPAGKSLWTVRLAPIAGTLTIHTVPRIPGVTFGIDDITLTTNGNGTATAPVRDLNLRRNELALLTTHTAARGHPVVHIERVGTMPPHAPHERRMLVALKVSRPVTLHFVDPRGARVTARRIQRIRLEQDGHVVTINDPAAGSVLLPSTQVRRVHGTWQTRKLDYTVDEVRVGGANTVFAGRQHLDPARPDTWRIRLSVYALTVTVRDALLGRRVTSTIALSRPDGSLRQVEVGADAPARITSLPRGLYRLDVNVGAVGDRYPVLISRDTHADLRVITRSDLVIVILTLTAIAVALVLTGRRLHPGARASAADEDS